MAKTKYLYVKQGKQLGISRFPNIHHTGSVAGMKKLFWGSAALVVKCGAYFYNVDKKTYEEAH